MEEIREYAAFISYRHKELDKKIAKKIHTEIERYKVPKEIRETWGSDRLGKVFRDEEELPASSNLTDSICNALDHSGFLIVICTPDTPESIWVEREIKYFLEHHDRDRMVAVLVDGTPETSFPKLLTTLYDENGNEAGLVEPLAANLTGIDNRYQGSRLKKEIVRIYAAIIGCSFDSLWQRERRHRVNRMLALVSILAMVALIYGISIYMKNLEIQKQNEEIQKQNNEIKEQYDRISEQKIQIEDQFEKIESQNQELINKNNEIEEKNTRIEKQKDDIERQNQEITAQNEELNRKETEAYIKEGELLFEKGDLTGAEKAALNAISSEEGDRKYADEEEYLLSRVLGAGNYDNAMRTTAVLEQEEDIENILLSKDKRYVFTLDTRGFVRCFSSVDGSLKWRERSGVRPEFSVTDIRRLEEIEEYGLLICYGRNAICAFDTESGSKAWEHFCGDSFYTDFRAVSKDHSKIISLDCTSSNFMQYYDYNLVILDSKDGTVEKELPVGDFFKGRNIVSAGSYPGTVTDDGKKLFGMVYFANGFDFYEGCCLFSVDLESGEFHVLKEEEYAEVQYGMNNSSFMIGMEYDAEKDALLTIRYDLNERAILAEEYDVKEDDTELPLINSDRIECVMPNREEYGAYNTYFSRKGDKILFACASTAAAYSLKEQRLVWYNNGSGLSIYSVSCLNESKKIYGFLTEDGKQHIYWIKGGAITVKDFSDKKLIKDMVISDDYVRNETGAFGIQIGEDTVEVIIGAAEARKAYILKPDKDKDYGRVDGIEFSENDLEAFKLEYLGNGQLAFWSAEKDGRLTIKLIDPAGANVSKTIETDFSGETSVSANTIVNSAILWDDGKHITYSSGPSLLEIYDLEGNRTEGAFGEISPVTSAYIKQDDGTVLHAGICKKNEDKTKDPEYEILWRVGENEICRFSSEQPGSLIAGDRYDKHGLLLLSKSGKILTVLFSDEKGTVDQFLIIDTLTGSSKQIKPETEYVLSFDSQNVRKDDSPIIVQGKVSSVFMAVGKDRVIRFYDAETGKTVTEAVCPADISDIMSVQFFDRDSKAVFWTKGRQILVFDTKTGELLYDSFIDNIVTSGDSVIDLTCAEDPGRNRVFFVTSDGSVLCLNTDNMKKQAEFYGFTAFCPETNEIYRIKNDNISFIEEQNEILKVKAYTLDDLLEKAKEKE